MTTRAVVPEPAPQQGQEDVWPRVVEGFEAFVPTAPAWLRMRLEDDMRARDEMGRAKYGTALQTHNGRSATADAYQETLDLCAYTMQAYLETGLYVWRQMHQHAVEMAAAIRYQLAHENGEGIS